MGNSIYHSQTICNRLKELSLYQSFTYRVIKHIMAILIGMMTIGYQGKTVDFARNSPHHRTTIAHFLNHGKWDEEKLENIVKTAVIGRIYQEAAKTGKPVLCIVDDTISSKTKPSSRAKHPIDDAYFHYSHLKKQQDYGHQAVSVMLSCNGVTLNYAVLLYDKSKSKIQMICDIAEELPAPPVVSYFLCDSWYPCEKVVCAFIRKGFYTISALKTNRILYPGGIRQKLSAFALCLRKTDAAVRLVTVRGCQYYVYRYEGKLNGLDNAVVLITYPKNAFLKPQALRAFLCTDVSLSTDEIMELYTCRWKIEVCFRQFKSQLAFDQYQIRSRKGIHRFWLLTSLAHFLCSTACGDFCPFQEGFRFLRSQIERERIAFIYRYGASHAPLDDLWNLIA